MESLQLHNTPPSPENHQSPPPRPNLLDIELGPCSGGRRILRPGPRPPPEPGQLSCPRCDSTNTKFCYYNNYNLSQPRHFCRSCRRYWTRGGALRNVPVGGGTRRAASSSSSSSNKRPRKTSAANTDDLVSSGSDSGTAGRAETLDPDPGTVPGPGPEEAKPGSASCVFWSNGQMGFGTGGLLPFNGYGLELGPGLGYEQAVLDWPLEGMGSGDGGAVVGESPGCGSWQMGDGGGGADGVAVDGDYFSWPELAISTPAKALK